MPVEAIDTAVLDTLAALAAKPIERCELDPHELAVARIAALVAVDARPLAYLPNGDTADQAAITLDDVEGILIAVAPVIGTSRLTAAARNIDLARAFGFVLERDAELTSHGHRT